MQQTLPFNISGQQSLQTPKLRLPRNGPPELVAALDLGSSKVTCVIARAEDDVLKICSLATEPSRGIERGELVDLDEASAAASAAITKAQMAAAVQYSRYMVGVAGRRCQGRNSRGSVAVVRESHEITEKNVRQALSAARTISLPSDRLIVDAVPQSFCVDDSTGVRNPIGMMGNRLDAEVYLATESVSAVRNIQVLLRNIGARGEAILFEPFATAEAVLTDDEKELGVVQIDIGEGTMDIVVYYAGAPRFARVLPVGGGHVVRDVAVGLSTTIAGARDLVHNYGVASDSLVTAEQAKQVLEAPTPECDIPHTCYLGKLCYIIECRVEEMLEIARREIRRAGFEGHVGTGVVLTGGMALLKGITKKAEQVFGTSARVGRPKIYTDDPGLRDNPAYATAVGLLVYGIKIRRTVEKERKSPLVDAMARSYEWVREFF